MRRILQYMLIVLTAAALWGCGGGGGGSTGPSGPTASEYTAEGWGYYETEDYDNALISFDNALGEDNTYYEAYLGKGLVYLADSTRYNDSTADSNLMVIYNNRSSFDSTDRDTILIPAYDAMLAYKVKNNTNLTFVKNLEGTLAFMDDGWSFSHNNSDLSLTWALGRLNQAELYFYGSSSSSDHAAARVFLDRVLNYSGYSSLPQNIKDKAQSLDAQFTAAGN